MPSLYALKPWYTRRLSGVIRRAVSGGISPDVFTAAGVACSIAAAVAIWRGWWPVVAVLLAGRLAGANLDGAVARARGVARPWGFVLNELGDRTSDMVMFAGLAALAARTAPAGREGWAVAAVAGAALAATLPTFASLSGAGAGAARRNGGPLGKTERCLLAVVVTAFPGLLLGVCALISVGSVLTCVVRLRGAARELRTAGQAAAA